MNDEITDLRPLVQENTGQTPQPEEAATQDSFSKLRSFGIAAFGFFVFFAVLLFKLPEARIQNLMIGHARLFFQSQGLSFSAEKVKLGLLFGPSVKFYNVELHALDDNDESIKIPYLKVSPNLTSLLGKNKSVAISAELLGGSVSGNLGGAIAGTAPSYLIDLDFKNIDPGQATLVKRYTLVNMRAHLDGGLRLDFDALNPGIAAGKVDLTVKDILLPEQVVYGFNLPALKISRCNIEIPIEKGRADFKHIECGKGQKGDDIAGQLSGQILFDRMLVNSRINAKANFQLSDTVKKAFPLLDAILAGGKTPDGSAYAFHLGGTVGAIEPTPGN